jgi:hypothetical protein
MAALCAACCLQASPEDAGRGTSAGSGSSSGTSGSAGSNSGGGLWSGWDIDGGACRDSQGGEPGPGISFCDIAGDCLGGQGPCEEEICFCNFADGEALVEGLLLDGGPFPVSACWDTYRCTAPVLGCLADAGQYLSPRCATALSSLLDQVLDGG